MNSPLLEILQCPRCRRSPLTGVAGELACPACELRFPALDGLPWLHADPRATLAEWRNRLGTYLAEFDAEARRTAAESVAVDSVPGAASRVAALARSYAEQAALVRALLAPLALSPDDPLAEALRQATGVAVPLGQDLHSYYANLHRDWAWGAAENAAALALVRERWPDGARRVLVLGSGAGRLAYDVHRAGAQPLTVALDINPLLLLVAARVAAGGTVELVEFPLAPRGAGDAAVKRRLAAPEPARAGLEFVFGDAWRAPFHPQSFDLVITPWLIDVVDLEPAAIPLHVNRLLADGGRWINFGSLAFPWRSAALRHPPDEVLAIVGAAGFEVRDHADLEVPYLCSPGSRHARLETVFAFAADRVRRAPRVPPEAGPPAWLVDGALPVPRTPAIEAAATVARLQAVLLALVDGGRSLDEITGIVVQQGLLPAEEARAALAGLLERLHADGARGRPRVN